ncbi:MAG: DUF3341 domain-containing protein [bacterium]|jgi:hypothetical protein
MRIMQDKDNKEIYILAEFGSAASLYQAAEKMRDTGQYNFDCHSPFPIHGMDAAMGLKRSPLGWIAGLCATFGALGGVALQWYASTIAYPLVISGKPFFSFQAYLPVTFALGVLMAAGASLFGMLGLNRLPQFHHPLFHSERFKRVTDDSFFISAVAANADEGEKLQRFLESIGGRNLEVLKD